MKFRHGAIGLILLVAVQSTPKPDAVGIQIQNVNLLLTRDIVLNVRSLRGELESTKPSMPVTFDDSNSFIVSADSAEIHITTSSMTALMNEYVFGYKGAPIKDVSTTLEGHRLVQTGKIHKAVDLPPAAALAAIPDGRLHLSPRRRAPLRQADHERRRPGNRRRPEGRLRFLPARVQETTRGGLLEEHTE